MSGLVVPMLVVAVAAVAHAASRRWWVRRALARCRPAPAPRWPGRLRLLQRRLPRRHPAPTADDVAPTLDQLARAVAAGSSLASALEALPIDPTRRPFAGVVRAALGRHHFGEPLADALGQAAPPEPHRSHLGRWRHRPTAPAAPEVHLGVTVLALAARHGGTTAASLDRVAVAVRERRAVVAERAVQSAQARLSALVLTVLPVGFSAWTVRTDARVAHVLFGTTLGWACLVTGLGLNGLGWWWMRRIIGGRP